jgi:hypothetical protein
MADMQSQPTVPDWTDVTYGSSGFQVEGLEAGFQARLTDAARKPHKHPRTVAPVVACLLLLVILGVSGGGGDGGGDGGDDSPAAAHAPTLGAAPAPPPASRPEEHLSPTATCESLGTAALTSDDEGSVTVLSAETATTSGDAPVEYCLVKVLVGPGAINIWVGLPSDGSYNARFMALGGGGFVGSVGDGDIGSKAVQHGYVGAATDTGHEGGDGSFGMQCDAKTAECGPNTALQEDFGWRSEHLMAVISKQLIASFYGAGPPRYSYWNGCSTGGRQGHAMAQRFPDDYDGIMAGAPAVHFEKLGLGQTWPQVPLLEETGAENAFSMPFYTKHDLFAKTGSGQT